MDAVRRSGASMSRHCFSGPTMNEDEQMESRLPSVYLKAKGAGLPRSRDGRELSAERESRPPKQKHTYGAAAVVFGLGFGLVLVLGLGLGFGLGRGLGASADTERSARRWRRTTKPKRRCR